MKKRHAALAALALVGILSGCGQTKTQPADNTISITPVEQAGTLAVYTYSGNNTEANGIEFRHYTWDGSTWKADDGIATGAYEVDMNDGEGKIVLRGTENIVNTPYDIEVDYPSGSKSVQYGDPDKLSSLSTENLAASICKQPEKIDDLAVDTEIPILLRAFRTGDYLRGISIDSFNNPNADDAFNDYTYAEALTVTFVNK